MALLDVRRCTVDDVAVIAAREPAGSTYAETTFAAQESGRCLYLVAWKRDRPVGSGELAWMGVPTLRNLAVQPTHRGQGIGTAITEAAEMAAKPHGSISLAVGIDNHDARRLYERLGYVATGRLQTYSYEFIRSDGVRQSATETVEHLSKSLSP